MSFLKDMDLYKAIVLLSAALLPLGGWWISNLDEEITQCENALRSATRSGGYLEDIGKLQKQIETVAQNRREVSIEDPPTYFEGQILAVSDNLKPTDFTITGPKPENVSITKTQKATDQVISVDWGGRGKKGKEVKMDFVYAVLFNCESGASAFAGAGDAPPSVWRLTKLTVSNSTIESQRGNKTPPPELEDRWKIEEMKFARREPRRK